MEPEPVRGELREWEAVAALVFDAGDVGFDSGVGAHVAVGFGSGCFAVGPVSPVSVALGVEQGSFRAGVEGFASYDQSEAVFGPPVGFDVVGELDHMGTNPLGFRIVDLRGVGVVNLGPVVRPSWCRGCQPRSGCLRCCLELVWIGEEQAPSVGRPRGHG